MMSLASAMAQYPTGLRVAVPGHARLGRVESVRIDPADRANVLVKVQVDGLRAAEEFGAGHVRPLEGTFLCELCRRPKPDSERRKAFGMDLPRSCAACYPEAQRQVMRQQYWRQR